MRGRRKKNVVKVTVVELSPSEGGGVTGQPGDRLAGQAGVPGREGNCLWSRRRSTETPRGLSQKGVGAWRLRKASEEATERTVRPGSEGRVVTATLVPRSGFPQHPASCRFGLRPRPQATRQPLAAQADWRAVSAERGGQGLCTEGATVPFCLRVRSHRFHSSVLMTGSGAP